MVFLMAVAADVSKLRPEVARSRPASDHTPSSSRPALIINLRGDLHWSTFPHARSKSLQLQLPYRAKHKPSNRNHIEVPATPASNLNLRFAVRSTQLNLQHPIRPKQGSQDAAFSECLPWGLGVPRRARLITANALSAEYFVTSSFLCFP